MPNPPQQMQRGKSEVKNENMTQAFIIRIALTRAKRDGLSWTCLVLLLLLFAAECIVCSRGRYGRSRWLSRGRGSGHKRIGNGTMQLPFEIKVSRHKASPA